MGLIRYALLGGIDVANGAGPVPLGTRKQRAVLAQLVLAGGQVVGMGRLIEGIWGDESPDRAEATVQSHISGLRRALEPDRPPRAPAQLLVTRGTGYALVAERSAVDVWRFTDAVERARQQHSAGDLGAAAEVLRPALAEYAPLLPEFEGMPFHDEAARHLERIHRAALELSYEIRLDLGEERLLVADLEVAVQRDPLHEGLWYLLAIARYRMGRQSESLAALAECRRVLADQIGVDPSPRLRQLERDILAQAPHLDPRPTLQQVRASATEPDEPTGEPTAGTEASATHLIGRLDELAVLHDAMVSASAGGNSVLIVEGTSGVGKTALLEESTRRAREHGRVTTLWGRCVEGEGAPSMWPWVQILSQVLPGLPEAERDELLDTELGRMVTSGVTVLPPPTVPDPDARFRLFGQAADLLDEVATRFPLLIVVDDIQWADAASLELLVHIASRRPSGAVFVGALRTDTALRRPSLEQALATLSRLPTHRRLSLGPLARAEVGELIRQETGSWPTADLVGAIETRTEGNPFFVRELSRLLRDSGRLGDGKNATDVSAGVPSGIRDVVRGRLAGLDTATTRLLQVAALIGKQVDLELLAAAAELDIDAVLDALEPAEALAVLEQIPDDPFAMRFSHDLMREAIAETVAPLRARRMHLQIADALDSPHRTLANRAERLAHHLWSAGPLAPKQRTASALIASSRVALGKFAYESAERQLDGALDLARGGGDADLELQALLLETSVISMRQGYIGAPTELLEHAESLATSLGYVREAADFVYARWSAASQRLQLAEAAALAATMSEMAQTSTDPVIRLYAEHATGVNAWDHGEIGASYRALSRAASILHNDLGVAATRSANLRHDLLLLSPAFHAFMTTLHVSVDKGRDLFDRMEADMGDDRYARVVLSAFAGSAATMVGDREWAMRVSAIGLAADPERTFVFLGVHPELHNGWARALLGEPDQGIASMRATIDAEPNYGMLTSHVLWATLLADALLETGRLDEVGPALDAADAMVRRNGQRYADPVTLLVRARYLHARGEPEDAVRAAFEVAAQRAREAESTTLLARIERCAEELLVTER
ncbi:MAG TPA: BTAD domain-containing putative transcriptional regulator [Aldersonia sp.]